MAVAALGLVVVVVKNAGELAKGVLHVWELAKTAGIWSPAPEKGPAPEKLAAKEREKEVVTGSVPRIQPAPAPCVPEPNPDDIIGTLYNYTEPQMVFAQLYRSRRVCSPGWTLTVESLPLKQDDGTWRIRLSSGTFGVWVVADTRADIGFLRPWDRVRVEGTVMNFQQRKLFKAGAVHIVNGRIAKF